MDRPALRVPTAPCYSYSRNPPPLEGRQDCTWEDWGVDDWGREHYFCVTHQKEVQRKVYSQSSGEPSEEE